MESRNIQLDTEWNMLHYPEKPSGFGILIIGDEGHFVNEQGSFWTQNKEKLSLLKILKEKGYTIFYSNLYGKNWGNDKAVKLARRLYEHIIRTEILNVKIHIVAEGMGSLIALKLMNEMWSHIRAIVLINPILSLKHHLELEKEHHFFYKKLVKDLASAYEIETALVESQLEKTQENLTENINSPVKIIQILTDGKAYKQADLLKKITVKWEEKELPVSICYMMPEKKQEIGEQMVDFFKYYEKVL